MKKIISFIFVISLLSMMEYLNVCANNSEVKITIEESEVANLYYRVVRKKKELQEDIPFIIQDEQGNKIYQGKTINSVLYVENVPFGKCEIIFWNDENSSFEIFINEEYVKEQHILKTLELYQLEKTVKTGDMAENRIIRYGFMEILLIAGCVFYEKKVSKCE